MSQIFIRSRKSARPQRGVGFAPAQKRVNASKRRTLQKTDCRKIARVEPGKALRDNAGARKRKISVNEKNVVEVVRQRGIVKLHEIARLGTRFLENSSREPLKRERIAPAIAIDANLSPPPRALKRGDHVAQDRAQPKSGKIRIAVWT